MPVPEYSGPNVSTANGVTTVFPYTFLIFDEEHLVVTVDGVEKTLNTDYTVSGVENPNGGNVTFLSAPADQAEVVRDRAVPYDRTETDYQEGGPFQADTIDRDVDLIAMQVQQLDARARRMPLLPAGSALLDLAFPEPGAGGFIRWNAAGDGLEAVSAAPDEGVFQQSGGGAIERTWTAKVGERVSAADFDTFAHAVTAAAGKTLVIDTAVAVPANITVPSTVTLAFEKGGTLVPAAAVTVTIQGAIQAGIQQIFNLAASGSHADLTAAKVDGAHVDWWGVVGGDVAFSSGNAAINKPLIDEAITYGPYRLLFRQKGIYSTTGHILSKSHEITGYPRSGSNLIMGSGIAFSDAAHVTGGDYSATKLYVFQNGDAATSTDVCKFTDVTVWGSDYAITTPTVIAIGVLNSSTQNLNSVYQFHGVFTRGFMGQHFTKCNNIPVNDCFMAGTFAAIGMTCPSNNVYNSELAVVQKLWFKGCSFEQLQASPSSGQIVYQHDARSDAPSGAIMNIVWDSCSFEGGYDGFVLAAQNQIFISPHMERISHTLVQGESSSYRSQWLSPTFGDVNTSSQLLAAVGVNSLTVLPPDIYAGSTLIAGTESPQASSFTATLTGCTTSPTGTVLFTVKGDQVTLDIPQFTGTSNATSKTLTGMPDALKPATQKRVVCLTIDNGGAAKASLATIGTNGTITLSNVDGNFTASGTFLVYGNSLSYTRD